MIRLNFGVVDFPYDYGEPLDATTYSVAKRLEAVYGLFSGFYRLNQSQINQEVGLNLADHIIDTFERGNRFEDMLPLDNINRLYQDFLSREDTVALNKPGARIPTRRALIGYNSRRKKKSGQRRPSFVDGGLQRAAFRAWIEFNG